MNNIDFPEFHTQVERQVFHWSAATSRLHDLENLASAEAWDNLEQYLGVSIRQHLMTVIDQLVKDANILERKLQTVSTIEQLERIRREVIDFRQRYLRTETTLDFYGDAINSRTNSELAAILRGCDVLASRSMCQVLEQLGKETPPALTYIDKGLGASILKAGLRLWDGGTLSPVAAIKIVRHNLLRPTALIHEAGHQVAHIIGWNEELAVLLETRLTKKSGEAVNIWASWASEIAADAFAFVHTGYAAVAALHDVLSGDDEFVFRLRLGDPHPMSYLRVLLGTEMCKRFMGRGPWNELAHVWIQTHPLNNTSYSTQALVRQSLSLLPQVVELTLCAPMNAFNGRSITQLVDPHRVGPPALAQLERQGGPALYTSHHWVWNEGLRLLALSGLHSSGKLDYTHDTLKKPGLWLQKLGNTLQAA